jgi:hypothetical protein
MHYLGARWYDPETGQFLTRDPLEGKAQGRRRTCRAFETSFLESRKPGARRRVDGALRRSLGQECGKKPHRSQPISISRKPIDTVPHIAQRGQGFGLVIGPSLWEPDGR